MNFENTKLIQKEELPDDDAFILAGEHKRFCQLVIEEKGIYLLTKGHRSKSNKKSTYTKICITDLLYQLWKKINEEDRKKLRPQIMEIIKN